MPDNPSASAILRGIRRAARCLVQSWPAEPFVRLSGASFIELGPDLAKETRLNTRQISGWASNGFPMGD